MYATFLWLNKHLTTRKGFSTLWRTEHFASDDRSCAGYQRQFKTKIEIHKDQGQRQEPAGDTLKQTESGTDAGRMAGYAVQNG